MNAENEVVAALRRIVRAIDLHSRYLLEKYGLTGPQLIVLQAAAQQPGATPGMLARTVHLSGPTVTGILDRLVRQGLVRRVRSSGDRRTVRVEVLPAGHDLLKRAPSPLHERFRRELGRVADWERSMILSTLQRIASMMDVEEIPASPVLVGGAEIEETARLGTDQAGVTPIEPPPAMDGSSSDGSSLQSTTTEGLS